MTTLISEDKEESIDFYSNSFTLCDGDMLIIAKEDVIDKVGKWLETHGVSGVYANCEHLDEYDDFIFTELANEQEAIRLYK